MIPKFEGTINNIGKLILKDDQAFKAYLTTLKGDVEVIVKKRTLQRSLPQNNWFHAINKMISDFMRQSAKDQGNELYYEINEETTKLWIKQKFLGYEEIKGERHLRHTRDLKTFEMNELWELLQKHLCPRYLPG